MRRSTKSLGLRRSILAVALITVTIPSMASAQPSAPADWTLVDEALGRGGTTHPDGVRRYSFPRSDLKVQLDGVSIKPALALGSWLAFQPMGNQAHVMGDLVLTHDEVNPVLSEVLKGGLKVTALHNHLLRSTPSTLYMHVEGHGDPWKLGVALRSALARSRTPLIVPAVSSQAKLDLDTTKLDQLMGKAGKANGGVYQFTFPRPEPITDDGMQTSAAMGTGTAINFQPTGSGKAAVTGDYVLLANEVDPVMRALNAGGIEITALHSHMLDESPRMYFMHFWAVDDAAKLAGTLRQALDRTRSK